MAIALTLTLNPTGDGLTLPPFNSGRVNIAQTSDGGGNPGLLDVTTSEVTLSFGSVAPGAIMLINMDPTNYVEWGVATGVYPFRLHPNTGAVTSKWAPHFVQRQSGTIYLKANTATCKVLILGYDE
jgi:hypothetical protein